MLLLWLATLASAVPENFAGTISYPPYANFENLNVTLSDVMTEDGMATVATFEWVYDKNAAGQLCVSDKEYGLKWEVTGTKVHAKGTGKDPTYYSFSGTRTGDHMTGDILEPAGVKVGTWSVDKSAPQVPSKCGQVGAVAHLWPMPKEYTNGTTTLAVVPKDTGFFTAAAGMPKLITEAFERYTELTFPHLSKPQGATPALTSLDVKVDSTDDSHPQLATDESYTLNIPATGGAATLHAKTVYGALRGLETFSQLVRFSFSTQTYAIQNTPWSIADAPRFPHRGLMVDTARHFEPLAALFKIIDSLPYAKINVLHWHMSDTQSFPLEIKSHPKFWDGSWSPQERYTQADVARVVEYARMRGVRVMVEFDMPGHAGSWCAGYPEICPSPSCLQPLNVANNATFTVINALMNEMTGGRASKPGNPSPGLFKDNFIHLGGDEVNTDCWTKTPAVNDWLKQHKMTADEGYAYFAEKVAHFAIAQEHRPVQWSEVFDHFKDKLAKETIVHIWKSVTNVTEVVALGYNVLINVGYDSKSWYLDNLDVKWDAVYSNEPCTGVPDNLCPLILGGHGEMWGETVDASDIEQTVYPRLGAIAERLWSPRATNDIVAAHDRIEFFRCLLNRRGVAAAPVNNAVARSAPPHPGSCYDQ